MKPHNVLPPPASHADSQEHLANVDPNLPNVAVPSSGKYSLKQEINLASGSKASLVPSRPSSSLASHVSGATFASIARAAELHAARARQELHTRTTNVLGRRDRPAPNIPESMPRKGRAWKKLDLSEVSDSVPLPAGKENYPEETATSCLVGDEDGAELAEPTAKPPTRDFEQAGPAMLKEQPILAPQPSNVLYNRLGEYVSESTSPSVWDISSTVTDLDGIDGTAQMPIANTSSYPTFNMAPARFYPQTQFPCDPNFEYADQEQEDAADVNPGLLPSTQLPPSAYPLMDDFVSNLDDFRATAEEALRSTYPFVNRSGVVAFYDATSNAVTQLKAKPPHHYPAVKGTRSDLERGSSTSFHDETVNHLPPMITSLTREHSEAAADRAIASAEWNLRKETIPQSQFIPSSKRVSTLTEEEDYESWINRRVPVVNATAKNARTDDPIVFGMRMTADGVFPVHNKPSPPPQPVPARRNRPNQGWYDLLTDTYRKDGRGEVTEEQPIKVSSNLFARNNPPAEPTAAESNLSAAKETAQAELANLRARETAGRDALRAANFTDDSPDETPPERVVDANDIAVDLLLPALANLATYQRGNRHYVNDYFNRMGEAPSWCTDHGPDGNKSFFGGDWGTPPARVGRDPRYRLNGRHGPTDWNGGGRRPARWMR